MTPINENFVNNILDHAEDRFSDAESFQLARLGKKYFPFTHLFSPVQVNRLRIKNRIVMGPMGNVNMADEFGRPNDKMIRYFTERARGGSGFNHDGQLYPATSYVFAVLLDVRSGLSRKNRGS